MKKNKSTRNREKPADVGASGPAAKTYRTNDIDTSRGRYVNPDIRTTGI
jgi:hypothetical protein